MESEIEDTDYQLKQCLQVKMFANVSIINIVRLLYIKNIGYLNISITKIE